MNKKKYQQALAIAREDAYIYGNGFFNGTTGERIDPKSVTVTTLANGMKCYTYGEMDPNNIKVTIAHHE